ncbi:hypothetical protein DealDRAFT_1777 [Dethiobacter alkaliphilus AHT 1]|uniref:Uncharacterized protein n=1 Tax=Dethiobacter alkaliphilus AHT 1 TaxID=555088 RepID=C0GH18_DETAL|nr:hypothetical protein DealDRAFT_1777 [Dethiobacter alkaliphilus AHT 1]
MKSDSVWLARHKLIFSLIPTARALLFNKNNVQNQDVIFRSCLKQVIAFEFFIKGGAVESQQFSCFGTIVFSCF